MIGEHEARGGGPVTRAWWRCPVAVTALHAQRALLGVLIAWPLARWVGGLVAGRPGGDATLLADGGILLAELLRHLRGAGRPIAAGALALFLVGIVVAHAATAGVVDAMARPRPVGMRARVGAAWAPVPLMVVVGLVSLLLGAASFALVWWCGQSLARAALDPGPARDVVALAIALPSAAAAAWFGVARDVVYVGVAGRGLGFFGALELSWRTLKARPFGLWLQRAIRSVAAGVALLVGALAALRIGMFDRGDATWAQLVLELSLVAATCLRASWLGVAVDAVAAESEVAESADELADPVVADAAVAGAQDGTAVAGAQDVAEDEGGSAT